VHVQVGSLLRRLQGLLPGLSVLGGVLQPEAWGYARSLRGALFMGQEAFDHGAVGCFLSGPLQVNACRRASCCAKGRRDNDDRQWLDGRA
jgi:small ligand-binding sensory domain FIST